MEGRHDGKIGTAVKGEKVDGGIAKKNVKRAGVPGMARGKDGIGFAVGNLPRMSVEMPFTETSDKTPRRARDFYKIGPGETVGVFLFLSKDKGTDALERGNLTVDMMSFSFQKCGAEKRHRMPRLSRWRVHAAGDYHSIPSTMKPLGLAGSFSSHETKFCPLPMLFGASGLTS